MPEITIRPIDRSSDTETLEVQSLAREVIRTRYLPFLGNAAVNGYIDSGQADAEITNHIAHLHVAVSDAQILGFAVCFDDLLHILMTRIERQRGGIGTRLLRWAEAEIKARGHQQARLETFVDNAQARAFYKKNDWIETEVQDRDAVEIPLVFLAKSL